MLPSQKLRTAADEIRGKYGVDVRYAAADFSKAPSSDDSPYERVQEALQDIAVGILVNNVGGNSETALYFHELGDYEESRDDVERLLNLNLMSALCVSTGSQDASLPATTSTTPSHFDLYDAGR